MKATIRLGAMPRRAPTACWESPSAAPTARSSAKSRGSRPSGARRFARKPAETAKPSVESVKPSALNGATAPGEAGGDAEARIVMGIMISFYKYL